MSSRTRLGWGPFFESQSQPHASYARVTEVQRGSCRVEGDVDGWAEPAGRLRHEASTAADLPAVGDWVEVARGVIVRVLPRQSVLSRSAAGRSVEEQVIAANVETIFVVTSAVDDLNARRLERYLAMIWDSGAVPVIVVNKCDLADDPAAIAGDLRQRLPFVDVVAVSAVDDGPLDALAPYLLPGRTVALVGSSGVGKSTLVNRLIGAGVQRVSPIRDSDGRGRHTTTARQLLVVPGGALIVDTPGMRELQPWGGADAVHGAFDDLLTLAQDCRFADCGHDAEPGCAVQAAVASGTLDADRLEHYRRLLREAAFEERKHDKEAAAAQKKKWKQIHKAQRALYRRRDGLE